MEGGKNYLAEVKRRGEEEWRENLNGREGRLEDTW